MAIHRVHLPTQEGHCYAPRVIQGCPPRDTAGMAALCAEGNPRQGVALSLPQVVSWNVEML